MHNVLQLLELYQTASFAIEQQRFYNIWPFKLCFKMLYNVMVIVSIPYENHHIFAYIFSAYSAMNWL